jgi:hypothetical protein
MENSSEERRHDDYVGKYYLTITYVVGVIWYWIQGSSILYAMASAYGGFILLNIAQLFVMIYTYIVERRIYWWRRPGMVVFVLVMYVLAYFGGQSGR